MNTESYDYFDFADKTIYFFESEGLNGKIPKAVTFTPIGKNLWNLAFGDLNKGEIDDSIISNNHDIVKLMSTITKIIYNFSDKHPTRHIYIRPIDEKRKKLYNHIFKRHYNSFSIDFDIIGTLNAFDEHYSPEKIYDIFKLKRKFVK